MKANRKFYTDDDLIASKLNTDLIAALLKCFDAKVERGCDFFEGRTATSMQVNPLEFHNLAMNTTDIRDLNSIAYFCWCSNFTYKKFASRLCTMIANGLSCNSFMAAYLYNASSDNEEMQNLFNRFLIGSPGETIVEFIFSIEVLMDGKQEPCVIAQLAEKVCIALAVECRPSFANNLTLYKCLSRVSDYCEEEAPDLCKMLEKVIGGSLPKTKVFNRTIAKYGFSRADMGVLCKITSKYSCRSDSEIAQELLDMTIPWNEDEKLAVKMLGYQYFRHSEVHCFENVKYLASLNRLTGFCDCTPDSYCSQAEAIELLKSVQSITDYPNLVNVALQEVNESSVDLVLVNRDALFSDSTMGEVMEKFSFLHLNNLDDMKTYLTLTDEVSYCVLKKIAQRSSFDLFEPEEQWKLFQCLVLNGDSDCSDDEYDDIDDEDIEDIEDEDWDDDEDWESSVDGYSDSGNGDTGDTGSKSLLDWFSLEYQELFYRWQDSVYQTSFIVGKDRELFEWCLENEIDTNEKCMLILTEHTEFLPIAKRIKSAKTVDFFCNCIKPDGNAKKILEALEAEYGSIDECLDICDCALDVVLKSFEIVGLGKIATWFDQILPEICFRSDWAGNTGLHSSDFLKMDSELMQLAYQLNGWIPQSLKEACENYRNDFVSTELFKEELEEWVEIRNASPRGDEIIRLMHLGYSREVAESGLDLTDYSGNGATPFLINALYSADKLELLKGIVISSDSVLRSKSFVQHCKFSDCDSLESIASSTGSSASRVGRALTNLKVDINFTDLEKLKEFTAQTVLIANTLKSINVPEECKLMSLTDFNNYWFNLLQATKESWMEHCNCSMEDLPTFLTFNFNWDAISFKFKNFIMEELGYGNFKDKLFEKIQNTLGDDFDISSLNFNTVVEKLDERIFNLLNVYRWNRNNFEISESYFYKIKEMASAVVFKYLKDENYHLASSAIGFEKELGIDFSKALDIASNINNTVERLIVFLNLLESNRECVGDEVYTYLRTTDGNFEAYSVGDYVQNVIVGTSCVPVYWLPTTDGWQFFSSMQNLDEFGVKPFNLLTDDVSTM